MVDITLFLIIIWTMKKIILMICLFTLACLQPTFIKYIAADRAATLYENGNDYFKQKDYQRAVVEFEKVVNDYPGTDAYEPALYLATFCNFKLNIFDKAVSLGEKFIKEFPNSSYLINVFAIIGESYYKLADDYQAVFYLGKFYIQTDESTERKLAFDTILKTLPKLSVTQLEKLHRTFMAESIDEHILYTLAVAEENEGKKKEAERDFELLTRRFPNTVYTYEVDEHRRIIDLGETTGQAGLLLPLSGKFANYGQKLLEIMNTFQKRLPFLIHYSDTKSDPIEAITAAAKLIEEKHVDFLIGPIFSIEAFGVCGFAYGKGVSVILPTALESRLEIIPFIFTSAQSSDKQVKILVDYSISQLGISKFAVIYPDLPKYEAIAQVFANAVTKNNREIVAMENFNPDSVTLRWQLEGIKKKEPEAIFLSMDTDMIINTAPQIAYYQLEDVKLLGIEGFNNEKVVRLGERYVENSIFVSPAPIDSATLQEFRREGLKEDDFISVRFFQILWKLKELKNYTRATLPDQLFNLIRGKEAYNIYKIKDGEFIKLKEITEEK